MIELLRKNADIVLMLIGVVMIIAGVVYYYKIDNSEDSKKSEPYVMMPFAYTTPDIIRVAQEGGPRLYMQASTLPENWSGYLETDDGTLYDKKCENPHQVVYAKSLVKAIVDRENKFHCFYNTSHSNLRGHLSIQLDKDRNWSLNSTGEGVVAPGPGQKTGCSDSHSLQGPQCYDPQNFTEEVYCPSVTGFQFSCSPVYKITNCSV